MNTNSLSALHSLDDDAGSHHICITMWPNGVGVGTNFCSQTGQSDWCEEEMPCYEDENKMCHIKNWCVCQWAWEMYVEKNGCDNIVRLRQLRIYARPTAAERRHLRPHLRPHLRRSTSTAIRSTQRRSRPVRCRATQPRTTAGKCLLIRRSPACTPDESDPTTHATALACLKTKCDLDAMRGRANATVSAYNAQHASRLNALAAAQ